MTKPKGAWAQNKRWIRDSGDTCLVGDKCYTLPSVEERLSAEGIEHIRAGRVYFQ